MDLQCFLNSLNSFLGHPLVVVLIGGFIAAIVGQRLAVSWESKRSALEQKHLLISDIAEELAKLLSSANLAEIQRDTSDPDKIRGELIEPIQKWTIFCEVIGTKLSAYFPNTRLSDDLKQIHEAAYTFAHLAGVFNTLERKEHVDRLVELLDLRESRHAINFDLLSDRKSVTPGGDLEISFSISWRMTRLVIDELRDKLFRKILTTRSLIENVKQSIFNR